MYVSKYVVAAEPQHIALHLCVVVHNTGRVHEQELLGEVLVMLRG